MTLDETLRQALERTLGSPPRAARRLSGGDINDAFEVTLEDRRSVFVKTNARAAPEMFPAEARGLALLAEARALRVPEVLAVSSGDDDVRFLALELVPSGSPARGHDETLGRGLAALHRFGTPGFGLDHDNFIGSLPQSNRAWPSWAEFYEKERLAPQLALAVAQGRARAAMRRGFERLLTRLSALVGPEEAPSRLHGDLWGGNLHTDDSGAPCLIDPAVYGGHREVDLAMMRLFGGFGERVFAAYSETFPLAPGWRDRIELYQLYPLMVHVNLFGGGYGASVERI
ncbi:MAG TPA: fructosamine kinase family protein, partial [Polyangiaceae bacterium]|nr:fructosamine kinase family protein [Polyangiaceae bacterium]